MLRARLWSSVLALLLPLGQAQTTAVPTAPLPVSAVYLQGPTAAVTEGRSARFRVWVEGPVPDGFSIDFFTEAGTAGALDFRVMKKTLTFPSNGSWEAFVDVDTYADAEPEGFEHFKARLGKPIVIAPAVVGVANGIAYATVTDGASMVPAPGAPGTAPVPTDLVGVVGDFIAVENGIDHIRLHFVRFSPSPQRLTVHFTVDQDIFVDLKPLPGRSTLMQGYIDFEAGEVMKTIELQAVRDGIPEGIETFGISISRSDRYRVADVTDGLRMPLPGSSLMTDGGMPIAGAADLSILDGFALFGNEDKDGNVIITDSQAESLLHVNDIRQHFLENCLLWTGVMISLTKSGSDRLASRITETPYGFVVNFDDGSVVQVPLELFTGQGSYTGDFKDGLPEVWPLVLEKALQKRFGTLCPKAHRVVRLLTGMGAEQIALPLDAEGISKIRLNVGRVYLATKTSWAGTMGAPAAVKLYRYADFNSASYNVVVERHAYVIAGYRLDANAVPWVFLSNPWGFNRSGWLPLADLGTVAAEVVLFGDGLPVSMPEKIPADPIEVDAPTPP